MLNFFPADLTRGRPANRTKESVDRITCIAMTRRMIFGNLPPSALRNRNRPLADRIAPSDSPLGFRAISVSAASLEAVEVAEASGEIHEGTRIVASMKRDTVGLACGDPVLVTELDEHVADEVHGPKVAGRELVDPGDVFVDASREAAVMVFSIGVVAATYEGEVPPVDPSAIAKDDLLDCLLVEEGG